MKKFITTASLLTTLAIAQNNTTLIEQPANRFLYQSFQMLAVLEPSLNDDQARDFILKHGCYCFPGGYKGESRARPRFGYKGPPLDELDGLCKDLWRSQRCLRGEEIYQGEECDIEDNFPWFVDGNGDVQCGQEDEFPDWELKPHNQCKYKNCLLELEFAQNVKKLIDNGYTQDPNDPITSINDGKYTKYCPVTTDPGNGGTTDGCCGLGTKRKPYNSLTKECCAVSQEARPIGTC